jgi:hypothetical protein
MVKAGGSQLERSTTLTSMKESMLLIRSMDSVCLSGPAVTYIKVNILRTRDTAQVR